ncbi:hypothetical protein [Novosphingobium sp. BW1]|uniref:hypothetical protein n=1 Tax=Novosphingobium sp. BW1 TaxID=2592621 RepID=UPI00129333BA|nr:hypothetical protein [Novosphingobium sp. BW1]
MTGVRAIADKTLFPGSADRDKEDYGRAAIWNAYEAWKLKVCNEIAKEISV